MVCRATSTAPASLHFTWKHDNVEFNDTNPLQKSAVLMDRINRTFENGTIEVSSILQITNVTHANAGKYQCMVTNNYGTTYSTKAKLSVLGKSHVYSFVFNYNRILIKRIINVPRTFFAQFTRRSPKFRTTYE